MTALLARIPGLAPCLVLAIALGGCGGGVGGGGAVSGAYVPKYPDSPVMFYERIDFQSGGKVAVTAFGDTQTGQYAIAEDGTVLVTLASGTAARFTDVGGGCLLGVTDPGLVEAAAEDGIDLNEVGKICRE